MNKETNDEAVSKKAKKSKAKKGKKKATKKLSQKAQLEGKLREARKALVLQKKINAALLDKLDRQNIKSTIVTDQNILVIANPNFPPFFIDLKNGRLEDVDPNTPAGPATKVDSSDGGEFAKQAGSADSGEAAPR